MSNTKLSAENAKYVPIGNSDYSQDERFCKLRQILAALLGFIHYTASGLVAMFAINLIVQLRREKVLEISLEEASWITSILMLPMAPLCILTGLVMQRVAKSHLLMVSFILEGIAWMIQYFLTESSYAALLVGRFLIGSATAIAAPIVPLYLAEVTHPNSRGFCISAVYMGMSFGIIVGNIIGSSFTWKTYILFSVSLTIISLALTCYLKESYVWYLKKNDLYNVRKSFYWYRGTSEEAKLEVSQYILDHSNKTDDIPESSFISDFKTNTKLLALPLCVTVTLIMTMHLSGYKIIILYSIQIMGSVLPSVNVYIVTIAMDAFRLVATIVGCILVKKYPLRLLYMISGIGSACSHGLLCIFKYYSYVSEDILPILSLISLAIFIVFASIGLASIPWVVCGEIFPLKVKSIGCGFSLFVYYAAYFFTIKYAPLLEIYLGVIGQFVFFGCCTTVGTIIIYLFMPETKNRTLGEIENSIKTK